MGALALVLVVANLCGAAGRVDARRARVGRLVQSRAAWVGTQNSPPHTHQGARLGCPLSCPCYTLSKVQHSKLLTDLFCFKYVFIDCREMKRPGEGERHLSVASSVHTPTGNQTPPLGAPDDVPSAEPHWPGLDSLFCCFVFCCFS